MANFVFGQWLLELFLSKNNDFHSRIVPVFDTVLPEVQYWFSALSQDTDSSKDIFFCRWWHIQSLQSQFYSEEQHSEIVSQFEDAVIHILVNLCWSLFLKIYLSLLFLYRIISLICCSCFNLDEMKCCHQTQNELVFFINWSNIPPSTFSLFYCEKLHQVGK